MDIKFLIVGIISFAVILYLLECTLLKRKVRKITDKIKQEWNTIHDTDTENSTIQDIGEAYKNSDYADNMVGLDDITWNDLEMDGIFRHLNYTNSSLGELALYTMLRHPIQDLKELERRKQIIEFFYSNEEIRIQKQIELRKLGKLYHISKQDYKDFVYSKEFYSKYIHIVIPLLLPVSITVILFNKIVGIFAVLISLFIVIYSYYRDKHKIEPYIPMLVQYGIMLNSIKGLSKKTGYDIIDQCTYSLKTGVKLNKKYKYYLLSIQTIVGGYTTELDTLMDYIRIMTHRDLCAFLKLMKYIRKNYEVIYECYETIGYIDSLLGLAMYKRQNELKYGDKYNICTPSFIIQGHKNLSVEKMYYPLIENPVVNSFEIEQSILITGSNATGKSTFLRTVGVNAVLAQTVYFVFAEKYSSSFYQVYTSINIRDNVFESNSCYMMEIKSIKRIMDAVNNETTLLCCLDEVLRGTNTIERIGASSEILKNLAGENVLCIAATHDIELTYILENQFSNYHFQEMVTEDDITFDFILYTGRAYTRNAIPLLKLLGYSDEIVSNAINKVNYFLDTGKWVED